MRYEEIEPHLIDFLQGKTDEANEYRIKAYLQKFPEFQSELDAMKETIFFVKKTPLADVKPNLKMDFYAMLSEAQKKQDTKKITQIWWENIVIWWQTPKLTLAFGFGLALTTTTLWFTISQKTALKSDSFTKKVPEKTEKILPKNIEPKENIEGKKTKSIDDVYAGNTPTQTKIQEANQNDKINAEKSEESLSLSPIKMEEKSYSRAINKDSHEWLDTDKVIKIYDKTINLQDYLAYIKNNDNVHQQLAALSELEKYAHLDEVRTQVLAQLPYIKNTHLQLATIDWIVKNHILEGALPLNRLLEQDLHPIVRDFVEDALESM
ncbi:MAG: hypothetical protein EAZ20_14045 [Bacteroidetes bacterium]|nr:MAG: hypothetical protein EAZ20_14045 [Bacteroidota bacterium]